MEKEKNDKNENAESQRNESINMFGKVVTSGRINAMSIVIAGQIEGHTMLENPIKTTKYEHIIPQLVFADESDDIDGVLFIINTVGGDVEAGLCIAEMIRGMKKPTVSLVLGGGHSIGIPLAVAAKSSFVAKSATMTVHPVRISGTVLGAVQSFEYLKRMQERINDFIIENSHISAKRLDMLMSGRSDMATDIGTILEGRDAVECGLIDAIGSYKDAMMRLESLVYGSKKENKN